VTGKLPEFTAEQQAAIAEIVEGRLARANKRHRSELEPLRAENVRLTEQISRLQEENARLRVEIIRHEARESSFLKRLFRSADPRATTTPVGGSADGSTTPD